MDYKKVKTDTSAVTRTMRDFDKETGNIYETVAMLSKRANQISLEVKEELNKKISEFASPTDNLEEIFLEIKKVLEKNSSEFFQTEQCIGSQAKQQKPGFHLYGNKEVSLFGKKPQQTYIAGVIQQKNYACGVSICPLFFAAKTSKTGIQRINSRATNSCPNSPG